VALLEVVASAVASWLLLGQVPTPMQAAAGGVLILAGVVLTQTARPAAIADVPTLSSDLSKHPWGTGPAVILARCSRFSHSARWN
jgi:hypothetical protein